LGLVLDVVRRDHGQGRDPVAPAAVDPTGEVARVSSSKRDRTTAPRLGIRPSRARHVDDRNVAPPAGYRPRGKRRPGEAAMEAQLAADSSSPARDPVEGTTSPLVGTPSGQPASRAPGAPAAPDSPLGAAGAVVLVDPDDAPPADPWWTPEREKAFGMALQGVPQHQVAAELGRDRHTVARWMDDDRFTQRLFDENAQRFRASRQRRAMQTVRLTDKADRLANKMVDRAIELADKGKDDLATRLAARDWLQEFRENSRREDEIYGVGVGGGQKVDVSVHGAVQHSHSHKGKVDVSFRAFLVDGLRNLGVDPDVEEVDAGRADEALAALAERALSEGTFLDELVEQERRNPLAPALKGRGS
jgi:hypothetical protein